MAPICPKMTKRARWYLTIAAVRHLIIGGFALLAADTFRSTSFLPIIAAAPLWFWGVILIGAGLACAAGAARGRAGLARLGLTWSATATALIAAGLLIAWVTGDLSSPTGPVVWTALALKDFIVCADPLRSPFEALASQLEDDNREGDRTGRPPS